MTRETCKTCFKCDMLAPGSPICRAHPARSEIVPEPNVAGGVTLRVRPVWLPVDPERDWCGEHMKEKPPNVAVLFAEALERAPVGFVARSSMHKPDTKS